MSELSAEHRARLEELRRSFREMLPRRLGAIGAAAQALARTGDRAKLEELFHLAHGLTGASGIYDLPSVSSASAALEAFLRRALEEGLSPAGMTEIENLVSALRAAKDAQPPQGP
jgi:HPt (histidine-containing phosphotransfer) domain-containing protein